MIFVPWPGEESWVWMGTSNDVGTAVCTMVGVTQLPSQKPQAGWLTLRKRVLSTVLEAGCPRSRYHQVLCFVASSSLSWDAGHWWLEGLSSFVQVGFLYYVVWWWHLDQTELNNNLDVGSSHVLRHCGWVWATEGWGILSLLSSNFPHPQSFSIF